MSDCSLNWMDNHRLTIVVGHAGSGKTEFSVNLAVALAQAGKRHVWLIWMLSIHIFVRENGASFSRGSESA